MAADRQRLAAALAYRQAEEERRRRMMESVPGLVTTPAQPAPRADFRTNLENLSIGLGEGLTNQLEGIKGIITDPVGTAKSVYEAGRAVIRDPSVIADALRYTAQKATSGPLGAGEVIGEMLGPRKGGPVMQELDVYHGTPHRFPATEANPLGEFDASKIGTGEGAQAYGHGIYYAESPDVAKTYRSSNDPIARKAEMLLQSSDGDVSRAMRYAQKKVEDLEKNRDVKGFFSPVALEQNKGALEYLKQIKSGKTPEIGALYKADLPDEMIDRMLDWDKPLSEQPAAVKNLFPTLEEAKAINAEMIRLSEATLAANDINGPAQAAWEAMYKSPQYKMAQIVVDEADPKLGKKFANGQRIYRAISGGDDKASAEQLRSLGIPGIRYLDAGSRGQGGSGTRNFVVFPGEEKKVRILERDGQKAPPQKIAQALEAAPRKPETAFNAPEVKPGDIVDGLKVRPEVANVGSIKASLDNYTVLPGIRSVSIADFGEAGPLTGNVDKLDRRTRNLADQITESKEITPLIVVYSGTQNYILEGSHRIDALDALGKKRIPVIAVIDEDDPPKFMRQKR